MIFISLLLSKSGFNQSSIDFIKQDSILMKLESSLPQGWNLSIIDYNRDDLINGRIDYDQYLEKDLFEKKLDLFIYKKINFRFVNQSVRNHNQQEFQEVLEIQFSVINKQEQRVIDSLNIILDSLVSEIDNSLELLKNYRENSKKYNCIEMERVSLIKDLREFQNNNYVYNSEKYSLKLENKTWGSIVTEYTTGLISKVDRVIEPEILNCETKYIDCLIESIFVVKNNKGFL